MSFFKRNFTKFKSGLAKTSDLFSGTSRLFSHFKKIDEELFEELEEILLAADVGYETTQILLNNLRKAVKEMKINETADLQPLFQKLMVETFPKEQSLNFADQGPTVWLFVGVNGVGKTTTIGKVAGLLHDEGKKVMLAAGDTFRAAAAEQLEIWGERSKALTIKQQIGSDPSAVIFDALAAAKARKIDILLCDTAGRLQNKVNLMAELAKIARIIDKQLPGAPHEIFLVLDATTGQNGLAQAQLFKECCAVTGVILTKLDGTAKGGIALAINHKLKIPIKFAGFGEGLNDLQLFDRELFVRGLFGESVK